MSVGILYLYCTMKTQTMYKNIANSLRVNELGHKACVTSCLSAQKTKKEADISTNQFIMSNVTVNKSEGLFLNGTVVKKAINKVGVQAHLNEAQQCVVKKFRQEIEASKLIAKAYAWFTSRSLRHSVRNTLSNGQRKNLDRRLTAYQRLNFTRRML